MEHNLEKLSNFTVEILFTGTLHELEAAIEKGNQSKIDRLFTLLFILKDELCQRMNLVIDGS